SSCCPSAGSAAGIPCFHPGSRPTPWSASAHSRLSDTLHGSLTIPGAARPVFLRVVSTRHRAARRPTHHPGGSMRSNILPQILGPAGALLLAACGGSTSPYGGGGGGCTPTSTKICTAARPQVSPPP